MRATILGLVLWFASLFLLRLMAKSDPKMRFVYLRHRRYKQQDGDLHAIPGTHLWCFLAATRTETA